MQNSYNPPQIIQESPVKLPLAPILSTPPDRRGNAMVSTRRGSSIFSPNQTLDQSYNPPPPPSQPHVQKDPSPDPDPPPSQPPQTTGATTSSSNNNNTTSVKYRECLKNHAASIGGHVVDGCGEFMPSGEEGTAGALKCAACDCHRNFHRKEIDGETQSLQPPHYNRNPSHHGQTPATHLHKHSLSYSKGGGGAPPTMVNFGGGGPAAESSSEDLDVFRSGGTGQTAAQPSRKRFRTKFSQEQKDRMQEFAVRIGWRIQKQDEQEVNQFCDEVGVKRQVFKVWMHNNKQAMKKRQI